MRDRLIDESDYTIGNKNRLKGFLGGDSATSSPGDNLAAPIADLFPECSVFFGDIAGFTAWSRYVSTALVC